MKFSIALGLLLAGVVSGKITQYQIGKIDAFLRQNQKLNPDFKLKAFSINGQNAEVTYEKEFQTMTINMTEQKGHYKVLNTHDIVSMPVKSPTLSLDMLRAPQIPLTMMISGFKDNAFQSIKMPNHFQNLQKQINKMQNSMKQKTLLLQKKMKDRKSQIEHGFFNNMKQNKISMHSFFEQPILLGGQHNMWKKQNNQIEQLIGGDGHDNWQGLIFEKTLPALLRQEEKHDLWTKKHNFGKINHNKKWKHTRPQKLGHHEQKKSWLSNNIPKFKQFIPLQSMISNSILNQGQRFVKDTLKNLKDKILNKTNEKAKQVKDHDKIEQIIKPPFLLGGDNDPDHIPKKQEKQVKGINTVEQIVHSITNLAKQFGKKQLLKKQTPSQNKKFEDIEQDDGQNEAQGKLKVLIK